MSKVRRTLVVTNVAILLAAGSFAGYASGVASAAPGSTRLDARLAASAGHHQSAPSAPIEGVPTAAEVQAAKLESIAAAAPKSPEKLLELLGKRIVAQDLEGILALHEENAAVVEYDGSIARGHKGIRKMYVEWFKSDPVLTVNPLQVVKAGGETGVDGKVTGRSASVMGTYTLEQTAADGTREIFSGNFCDIVRQQPDGSWLYVQDNPYPPHS